VDIGDSRQAALEGARASCEAQASRSRRSTRVRALTYAGGTGDDARLAGDAAGRAFSFVRPADAIKRDNCREAIARKAGVGITASLGGASGVGLRMPTLQRINFFDSRRKGSISYALADD